MDHKEFDELVARLANAASRRDALKGLVGSSLAAVGITTAASDDAEAKGKGGKNRGAGKENKGKGSKNRGAGGAGKENKGKNKKGKGGGGDNDGGGSATAEACIPTGKKCPAKKPRGRKGKTLGCDKCCQRRTTTNATGKTICYCAETGTPCTQTRECCDGVCASRVCRPTT